MAAAPNLEEMFKAFSKFGDTRSDGSMITLSQSDKWMKQAGIIDGKRVTTTDTGICFNKFKSKSINFGDFIKYVDDLASYKKIDAKELKDKLVSCGLPGTNQTTQAVKTLILYQVGAVDRLTDTTKYTGSHKERFDESGKGRGIEGRADVKNTDGYVQGYKEKDTYDAKHK